VAWLTRGPTTARLSPAVDLGRFRCSFSSVTHSTCLVLVIQDGTLVLFVEARIRLVGPCAEFRRPGIESLCKNAGHPSERSLRIWA
jgi:hypothetical protein